MLAGAGASAQNAGGGLPAEFPPQSYEGNQYVDSRGCAFIRAGISGITNWVPRLTQQRAPVCGFEPTFGGSVPLPAANSLAGVPIITIPGAATPQVAAATATEVGGPIATIASITVAPAPMQAPVVTTISPSPQIIAAPVAPILAAPAEPRRTTLADACRGRFGIQSGFVSSRTGQPVDCGPAPSIAAAPVVTAPVRLAAQTCTSIAEAYFTGGTGVAVRCGPQAESPSGYTTAILTSGAAILTPVAPSAPSSPRAPSLTAPVAVTIAATSPASAPLTMTMAELCNLSVATGTRYVDAATGLDMRCGPQVESPSGMTGGTGYGVVTQGTVVARMAHAPATAPLFGPEPVPASNPVNAPAVVAPPAGYVDVWTDGRLNSSRGLPPGTIIISADQARTLARAPQTVATPQVEAVQPVSAPVGNGHRYVQVGSYADPANADRAIAQLRGLGLPIGAATATQGGQQVRIILAGPFSDAGALQNALGAARNAGFGDAFTRR